MAPEERLAVDDWVLFHVLLWKGSPALRQKLAYVPSGLRPSQFDSSKGELVIVVPEDDALLTDLRIHGFVVKPNASQAAWVDSGKGFRLPGRRAFRIYFVTQGDGTTPSHEVRL